MSDNTPQDLEQLIRTCGLDWIIDFFQPQEQAVAWLQEALQGAAAEARARGHGFEFTVEGMVKAYPKHTSLVTAFLQALGATRTPQMLVMVSRILEGAEISEVQMEYRSEQSFRLRVVLATPYGEVDPPYETSDINDASLLRHFGIMKTSDKPLFDGFYALRQ